MTHKTFTFSPTVSINYEVHGDGSKPLVFLHGFGASLETWRDIQSRLQGDFTIYLVDLKGAGLSSKPQDSAYSLDDQAKVITAFMLSLNLEGVTLVGHSYGGGVALMTYLNVRDHFPNRVDSLVLIDGAAYPQKLPFFVSVPQQPVLRTLTNLLPARYRASYTLKRIVFDPSVVTDERVERYARYLDLPGAHYALAHYAGQIIPPNVDDFLRSLSTIQIPTLIVWGADDPVIPVTSGERLKREIPNSELRVLERCGHIPQEEHPQETAAILTTFVNTLGVRR